MSETECQECGGLKNRYGLFDCDEPFHPKHTIAENCMADIEADIRDRRGFGFGSFDDETQWKIRDAWIAFIEKAVSSRISSLRSAAEAVVAMECDRVNLCKNSEPYDPIANPGQFDERIVALALALLPETDWRMESLCCADE